MSPTIPTARSTPGIPAPNLPNNPNHPTHRTSHTHNSIIAHPAAPFTRIKHNTEQTPLVLTSHRHPSTSQILTSNPTNIPPSTQTVTTHNTDTTNTPINSLNTKKASTDNDNLRRPRPSPQHNKQHDIPLQRETYDSNNSTTSYNTQHHTIPLPNLTNIPTPTQTITTHDLNTTGTSINPLNIKKAST